MVSPRRKVRTNLGKNEIMKDWLKLFCIYQDGIKWIGHNLKARNVKKIINDFFYSELVSLRPLRALRETLLSIIFLNSKIRQRNISY